MTPKIALDAVNEELMRETDYPADDKDYNNPFYAKGTEYDPTKMGAKIASVELMDYYQGLCHVFAVALHLEHGYSMEFAWDAADGADISRFGVLIHAFCVRPNGSYVDASGTITKNEAVYGHGDVGDPYIQPMTLAQVSKLSNGKALARYSPKDIATLRAFIRRHPEIYVTGETKIDPEEYTEPEQPDDPGAKTAEIDLHVAPKFLPPRHDQRSILDEDVKKEMDDDPDLKIAARVRTGAEMYTHGAQKSESVNLTPEQEAVWNKSFDYYKTEQNRPDRRAQQLADEELIEHFPELKTASEWIPSTGRLVHIAGDDKESFTAEFTNLKPEQAKEFRRLFAWMNALGGRGSSREMSIWYDGDGSARCKILVDGEEVYPEKDDKIKQGETGLDNLKFGFE